MNALRSEWLKLVTVRTTWYLLGASIFWLVLGNVMMFKMANFRF